MSLAYMGAPSRTAPCRGPELVSSRCILRKLREGASPGGINRVGPRWQGSLLGTSSLVCESSGRIGPGVRPGGANRGPPSPRARCNWKCYNAPNRWFLRKLREGASPGGINRVGPRSQGSLLGTSSLVCESSGRIGPGVRPGGANRGPPSPRARCNWKCYNAPNRWFLRKLREGASPGGINREGPRSQGTLLGTSSLVCERSDRIAQGTRPGEANRGPPSPRARRLWTLRYFRHSGTCLTDVSAPTGPPIAGATAGYVVCVVLTFGLDRISHLVGRCESPTPSSWGTERRWPTTSHLSHSALCRAPRTASFHQVGAPCRAPTAAGREPRSPPRPHSNNGPGLHANARGGRSAAGPHEPPLRRVPPALHFAVHPEHRLSTKSGPRAGPPLQPGESPAAPLGPTLITDRVFTLTLVGDGAPLAPTSHLSDECLLLCTLPCTQNTVFPPSRGPVPGPHCSRARAPQPPSAPL